jgi:hypothetical protein
LELADSEEARPRFSLDLFIYLIEVTSFSGKFMFAMVELRFPAVKFKKL